MRALFCLLLFVCLQAQAQKPIFVNAEAESATVYFNGVELTHKASAKLPAGTVENLLKPENKAKLVAVLTYHVVPGKVMSKDLKNGQKAKTVQGSEVTVTLKDGKAMIDNATVTAADIEASNGVVHVIDAVILPKM